jgi:hypothetical protein
MIIARAITTIVVSPHCVYSGMEKTSYLVMHHAALIAHSVAYWTRPRRNVPTVNTP